MAELTGAQSRLIDEAAAVSAGPVSLGDIQHVVILMQENRSFDHYFGTLPAPSARWPGRPAELQPGFGAACQGQDRSGSCRKAKSASACAVVASACAGGGVLAGRSGPGRSRAPAVTAPPAKMPAVHQNAVS